MRFPSVTSRWWVAAYLAATLVCTAGWLVLGQRLIEQTGLRRQVWLANDFPGRPVINDVSQTATTDFLDDDPRLPREFISARWHGYWYVPSRQSFTLHVHADDYADIWIDGEQPFARSSATARAIRLDAGVHELRIDYQQYAGEAHLELYEGWADAYPLPLQTGHLFPSQPEPNLLRLATLVDRLKFTLGILGAVGALGAAVFIVRRRRAAIDTYNALPASVRTPLNAVSLTALCLTVLVYGYGNLTLRFATADGLHNLRLGIRLAQDGMYRRWSWQVDEHSREPFPPFLIAVTDLASDALGFGAVPMECVNDDTETIRSQPCQRQYVPYRAINLALLVLGAVGVFWLVLRLTRNRTLACLGFLMTAQSAALLASAGSFYTEVHAASLMVAVGALSAVTTTTRRLAHAALLGLALAALVLTKVIFIYLWIPIALALAAADLLRRRLDWTTAGLVGVMLIAHGIPIASWMTRNYLASGDFSIVEARSGDVLPRRVSLNTMRHDEWVAGFAYYLPPTGASWWLEGTPGESFERFERFHAHGFRATAVRLMRKRRNELREEGSAALTGLGEQEKRRWMEDTLAVEARARFLADPMQHFKVGLLLAWRGVFAEEGLGFLSDPLTQRLANIHGYPAWPRWRRAYGATAATLVNLIGFLALLVAPLWFWLGRGRVEAVLVCLPALYAHGAYTMASQFVPRFALPQIPLRVTATMLLLFLAWSSLHRFIRPIARGGRPASIDQRVGTGERSTAAR